MSLVINHNLMAMNASRSLSEQYGALGTSTRRLSSGLRVGTAADDAAGLAIRELMRAETQALNQGMRNANDAISAVQVADGALQVIDEKLIRMKELAVQASTGTYNSDQRVIINSEYQAMAEEIQRIASSTDFNGIHLLNGNLSGAHSGNGLRSEGAMKIHFGTGNDSAEDYYYMQVNSSTLLGLDLALARSDAGAASIGTFVPENEWSKMISGIRPLASIPPGSTNVTVEIDNYSEDDDIQIFTRSGVHLAGTSLGDDGWGKNSVNAGNVNSSFITTENGFYSSASYNSTQLLDGRTVAQGGSGTATPFAPPGSPQHTNTYSGMTYQYSGDGDTDNDGYTAGGTTSIERFNVDYTTEELLIFSVGQGSFEARASWNELGSFTSPASEYDAYTIETQSKAQDTLERIDQAIVTKDKIRAGLGALQNRLENTVTNLSIQAENLTAAESRISDVDVANEMTEFARHQILSQSATAMLAQANSLPKMAMQLIGG